jgi:DNA (cytosine-5)-methyltransferase 1
MGKKLTVIDIFSGAGGLSKGFYDSGFKILSAVELDKDLSQTYKKNFFSTKVFDKDISLINSRELLNNNKNAKVLACLEKELDKVGLLLMTLETSFLKNFLE